MKITLTGFTTVAMTGGDWLFLQSSAASESSPHRWLSVKITLQRGSPPHLSSSSFESPKESEASVANTTLGPKYLRSTSLELVRNFT